MMISEHVKGHNECQIRASHIPTRIDHTSLPSPPPPRVGYQTSAPTTIPTVRPTQVPTDRPTKVPTQNPSVRPTRVPTIIPTRWPTTDPSTSPTRVPTQDPTVVPTTVPSLAPTALPTLVSPKWSEPSRGRSQSYERLLATRSEAL
jgi:hypothetical protein